ncbi:MAG: sensor histidine kinase [Cyanophyceae cyanobacterium]
MGTITTDRALLERILLELLNNACKYTPPQGSITLLITTEADQIHFQITNTGVTIPPDEIPKLFDKFHRIARLDTYQQGGTGLGLALVKKACELLQGEIEVENQDKITRFAVRLPVSMIIPAAKPPESDRALEDRYTRNQKRQDRMAD